MAVQLGPFKIDHPFIMAPMAGITNSPFRRLMRRMRNAVSVSELVSANGMAYGGKKTLELLRFEEEERPIGLQIFGEDAERMVTAAQVIEKLGADFVDLNLGCPVPKVVKKGGGAAMCRDVPALYKTLSTIVKSVKIPVTIKIRSGWDEGSRNGLEVARAAADAGVAWVAIHGRTRAQGYSGEADWNDIGAIKAKSSIPVIGNGDIGTAEVAVARLRNYGVDAVMIGRGVLRNPFIFEQSVDLFEGRPVKQSSVEDYLELLQRLNVLFHEYFPPRGAMLHARKFLAWFSAGFPGCHEFRRRVFTLTDDTLLWEEARHFFAESARHRDLRFMSQPFLMGGHG